MSDIEDDRLAVAKSELEQGWLLAFSKHGTWLIEEVERLRAERVSLAEQLGERDRKLHHLSKIKEIADRSIDEADALRAELVSAQTAASDLTIDTYEDDHASLRVLRSEKDGPIHPELERQVAAAIKEYPNQDAPQWLSPVAAILVVERWITAAAVSLTDESETP